ncbi:MAG: hypothetical protein ACXWOH_12535 [Bdellovibrionota bacterium]
MSWIDDDLAKVKRVHERRTAILQHSRKLYDDLWEELTARLSEAREKGIGSDTNGSPSERVIIIKAGEWKEIHFALSQSLSSIAISGDKSQAFEIDTDKDNVVCLTHNGKVVSIPDAARLILEPLIFPELAA